MGLYKRYALRKLVEEAAKKRKTFNLYLLYIHIYSRYRDVCFSMNGALFFFLTFLHSLG